VMIKTNFARIVSFILLPLYGPGASFVKFGLNYGYVYRLLSTLLLNNIFLHKPAILLM
jgi:hypothetical protein